MDKVFGQLTGLGARRELKSLLQSPFTLHETMIDLIRAEERAARAGRPARIMAKMNSLLEEQVIEALYRASQAGVKIDLVVRGVCAAARACRACPRTSGCDPSWALPGAFAGVLLPCGRPGDGLSLVGRLDGPQFLPPRRGRLPGLRQGAQEARHRRGLHLRPARQPVRLAAAAQRGLRPRAQPPSAISALHDALMRKLGGEGAGNQAG